MRTALLAALVALAPASAQGPALNSRAQYINDTLSSFRTTGQSALSKGFGGELLQLAAQRAESVIAAQEAEGVVEALGDDELEEESRLCLEQLAAAYSLRMRSRFMRLVSSSYQGNTSTLEDALVNDFQVYTGVNLSLIPERVTVQGNRASVQTRYNLSLVQRDGAVSKFQGLTAFDFTRDDDGKVRLIRMQDAIFGNSLPASENPRAVKQGPSVGTSPTAPGSSGETSSGATILTQGSRGFQFLSASLVPESSADVFKLPADLSAKGGIVSLGSCSLSTVQSVPTRMPGTFAPANVGECYGIRTSAGQYAAIRIKALTDTTASIDYKFRRDGSNKF